MVRIRRTVFDVPLTLEEPLALSSSLRSRIVVLHKKILSLRCGCVRYYSGRVICDTYSVVYLGLP